jgi:large subunit ribosomal protein L13
MLGRRAQGRKAEQKMYRHHTRTRVVCARFRRRDVCQASRSVISLAVQGMLPKNKLGKAMAKKLKVYADAEHPHTAQRPQATNSPLDKTTKSSLTDAELIKRTI